MYKFIVFFFFVVTIYAQDYQKKNDSIIVSKEIKSFIKTSDSIKEITKLIRSTLPSDTIRHLAYTKLFFQRSIENKNYKHLYYAAYRLGHMYSVTSDYPQSIAYTNAAIEASVNSQDTAKHIKGLILNAGNYFNLNLLDRSLKQYIKARKYAQKIKRKDLEFVTLPNIANIRTLLKRYEEASAVFNTTIDILEKKPLIKKMVYESTLFTALLGRGECQKELGQLDEALLTYEKGVLLAEKSKLLTYVIDFQVSKGHVCYLKGNYETAIEYLTKAKENIKHKYKGYTNIAQANYYLAECYVAKKENEKAIELLNYNFRTIEEKDPVNLLEEMYELRIQIAKNEKDLKTENDFQQRIINIVHEQNKKKNKTIELLHNNDIEKYQNINQELEIQNNKIKFENKTAITFVVILLSILVFSFFYYSKKNKAKAKRFEEIIKEVQEQHLLTLKEKPKSIIKNTQAQEILNNLSKLEKTAFFKSKECNSYTTAKAIKTNTTYLSKALNEIKKQSFNQYLNELRIDYVLLKLKEDTRFRSYTIKAISEEIGYKSVTTFLRAFKAKTNLNPSYYIEKLNVKNKKDSSDL